MNDDLIKKQDPLPDAAKPLHVVRTYAEDFAKVSGGSVPNLPSLPPEPSPPPAKAEVPREEMPDTSREDILARLRSNTPIAVGQPVAKTEAPERPNFLDESLELPPEPIVPLSKEVPPPPAEEESDRIHTYKSDFADHVEDTSASAFSVLAAEQDARSETKKGGSTKRMRWGIPLAVLGVLLVVLGGGAIYYAYVTGAETKTVPVTPTAPSLISVDEQQELSGSGHSLLEAVAASSEKPLAAGAIRLLYLSQATGTAVGSTSQPASGGALIQALALPAPGLLLRNIDSSSTVGIVHASGETRAFFIFHVTSYERTFAGMLEWEKTIGKDLGLLYPSYPDPTPVAPVLASTTISAKVSTSTVPKINPEPTFTDQLVGNYNVRALKDALGRTILLYGYRDKTTLIIARDENAFIELASRLITTKTQ